MGKLFSKVSAEATATVGVNNGGRGTHGQDSHNAVDKLLIAGSGGYTDDESFNLFNFSGGGSGGSTDSHIMTIGIVCAIVIVPIVLFTICCLFCWPEKLLTEFEICCLSKEKKRRQRLQVHMERGNKPTHKFCCCLKSKLSWFHRGEPLDRYDPENFYQESKKVKTDKNERLRDETPPPSYAKSSAPPASHLTGMYPSVNSESSFSDTATLGRVSYDARSDAIRIGSVPGDVTLLPKE